jgi:hypothetical protein
MELSVNRAARTYPISRRGLQDAIRRGALPAHVVPVLEVRVHSKDVEAYLKTVPPWRQALRRGKRNRPRGTPAAAPPPPAA